jgi:hypothetical protein
LKIVQERLMTEGHSTGFFCFSLLYFCSRTCPLIVHFQLPSLMVDDLYLLGKLSVVSPETADSEQ